MTTPSSHSRADVLHIGYPKAASTFVVRFLETHPDVTIDHYKLSPLLYAETNDISIEEKPCPVKIHVSKDENIAESVCFNGNLANWRRYLYTPGAWDLVRHDLIVDPGEAARRLHEVHERAKVLLIIREQADWLQSVYKYAVSQLPWNKRSFGHYCSTPSGIALLQSGHFDRTITAYSDTFGGERVRVMRFEDILLGPKRFAGELCAFLGISERPIPQRRENESHAQIARLLKYFPVAGALPRNVKDAIKPHAARLLPGGRGMVLSSREVRMLRGIYAASNQRTERLMASLATGKAA